MSLNRKVGADTKRRGAVGNSAPRGGSPLGAGHLHVGPSKVGRTVCFLHLFELLRAGVDVVIGKVLFKNSKNQPWGLNENFNDATHPSFFTLGWVRRGRWQ